MPATGQNGRFDTFVHSDPEKAKQVMSGDQHQAHGDTGGSGESVAVAIAKYEQGDDSELSAIVFAFHAQLLAKARKQLSKSPNLRSVTDSEGAVSSAMESYWRALKDGKYRDMKHSSQLLGLLVKIVERKAGRQIRKHKSARAGGGKVLNEPEAGLVAEGREPSPVEAAIERECVAQMEAVIRRWHQRMREKGVLDVAELVLEGRGYRQIAKQLTIRDSKARRLITTVNALTKEFAQEEKPDA
jgi:DNA-directed RNA polymerase specialized sigma24 family protein